VRPNEVLALVNACMNGLSAVLAVTAWTRIKRKDVPRHRALMISALSASTLFLVGYLTRIATYGDMPFAGVGWVRYAYFALLASHVLLALVTVPLVLRTFYLALRKRFDAHRRIARVTFPIWAYVSITGVIVYVLLYHWPTP